MPGTATYIVYQKDGKCYVWDTAAGADLPHDRHGNPVPTTPEGALQVALDLIENNPNSGGPGDVYVTAGTYRLTDTEFKGFNVHSYTNLRLDGRAEIIVPPEWEPNAVFNLLSDDDANLYGVTNSSIDGGRITAPDDTAEWTAFRLKGSSTGANLLPGVTAGMQYNKIINTEITRAGIGVEIIVDKLRGYVNSNTFEFLRMGSCRNFVRFSMADLEYTTGIPIWANRFVDLQCGCSKNGVRTTIGIAGVTGRQNEFHSVKVWDIQNAVADPATNKGPLTIEVLSKAKQTLIVGGILVGGYIKQEESQITADTTVFPQLPSDPR